MKKKISFWYVPLAVVLTVLVTLGGVLAGLQALTGQRVAQLLRLLYVVHRVQADFVGDLFQTNALYDGAMKGLVKTLNDPYSEYLDHKAFQSMSQVTNGTFGGIGVVLGQKEGELIVVAPQQGSPGDKAGIKAGDKILAVDGEDMAGHSLEDCVSRVRGEKGTHVKIKLRRKDSEATYTVDIIRDDIKIESVAGEILPGTRIGYIRIAVFNEQTGADFAKTYKELEGKGMQALLLDLRQNPGGLLTESLKVANYLVPKGPVVTITDKEGRSQVYESNLPAVRYPLAVLVDHGSASASEIVAGAIQDTKAGRLFGVTTYGKGCVQTIYQLSPDTALKLTTAMYYTPSGRSIHKKGITPDQVIPLPEHPTQDVQLEAARQYLLEQLRK